MPPEGDDAKLSGVLVVDKPEGVTSHDVVSRARKSLGLKKIGHAGTLDPFATGALVLLVGEGTKLSDYLMEGRKTYLASVKLGEKTDTGDLSGEIIETAPFDNISLDDIKSVLPRFEGEINQLPPMYSALKKNGVPLYKYARRGEEVERAERKVFIHSIRLLDFKLPHIEIEVSCSKGTYIRTLAEDISAALGTRGHLVQLRRVGSGSLSIKEAVSFDDLALRDNAVRAMRSLADSISSMPKIIVSNEGAEKIRNGARLIAGWIESYDLVEVKDEIAGDNIVRVLREDGSLLSISELITDEREYSKCSPLFEVAKSIRVFN
ncbi:MAG: tRNA pseudouridine(55) synthase TruB [bacterium]|nr:tRNA pseudouridine(55) synthase TruB [bacterium]